MIKKKGPSCRKQAWSGPVGKGIVLLQQKGGKGNRLREHRKPKVWWGFREGRVRTIRKKKKRILGTRQTPESERVQGEMSYFQ